MDTLREATSTLLGMQNADAGWGARAGAPSNTEATALSILALDFADELPPRGANWLRDHQREDGSWPVSEAVPGGSWMTSLAVLASTRSAEMGVPRAVAGARWLLSQKGRRSHWLVRLINRLSPDDDGEERAVVLDPDLAGWPWTHNTFSWIEPTSYALLALKTVRTLLPERRATARIQEGESMILDRMCDGGGWNYGNPRVLGTDLWPYPDTTALALLALQGSRSDAESAIEQSIATLHPMLAENESGLALALSILALQVHGVDVSELRNRLSRNLGDSLPVEESRPLALAVLALNPSRVPLLVGHD